jgi:hypothetical protein
MKHRKAGTVIRHYYHLGGQSWVGNNWELKEHKKNIGDHHKGTTDQTGSKGPSIRLLIQSKEGRRNAKEEEPATSVKLACDGPKPFVVPRPQSKYMGTHTSGNATLTAMLLELNSKMKTGYFRMPLTPSLFASTTNSIATGK